MFQKSPSSVVAGLDVVHAWRSPALAQQAIAVTRPMIAMASGLNACFEESVPAMIVRTGGAARRDIAQVLPDRGRRPGHELRDHVGGHLREGSGGSERQHGRDSGLGLAQLSRRGGLRVGHERL